jgi:hypothetical protein
VDAVRENPDAAIEETMALVDRMRAINSPSPSRSSRSFVPLTPSSRNSSTTSIFAVFA